MKIAIIGHGNVGGALAKHWANFGHEVIIGARNSQDEKVQDFVKNSTITATDILDAVSRHFPPLFEKIVFSILTTKNIQNFQMEGFHVQDDWLFV